MPDKRRPLAALIVAVVATGCAVPKRQHRLIDHYAAAACVALSTTPTVRPPVREWDAMVRTSRGQALRLSGAQAVSGRIVARDETGTVHVVADAGDYVYPDDVRADAETDRVFVKASGLAGGLFSETWLFEYDLRNFRQVGKIRVDPTVLPPECPGGPPRS